MLHAEFMERGRQEGREFRLQKFVQSLRSVDWLEKLLRHPRGDEGGSVVSEGNGNQNGAAPTNGNGGHSSKDADSTAESLETMISEVAAEAMEEAAKNDPFAADKDSIYPRLTIGAQMPFPGFGPDRSQLPEDDPERIAYEQGNPIPLSKSPRYRARLALLEELDTPSGFNRVD